MTAAVRGFLVNLCKPFERNTLRGSMSLELPSGMILHDCTVHEKNGLRWVWLPARQYEKAGTKTWAPLVEFNSKETREKFQAIALAAFAAHMAGAHE